MNPDLVPLELSVPPTLEERTATALLANGLLRPPRRHPVAWVRIAAALVLFASGVGVGRAVEQSAGPCSGSHAALSAPPGGRDQHATGR